MLAALITTNPTPACTVNGQVVPCDQVFDKFSAFFVGFGLVFIFCFVLGIVGLVLTILMIIHAAQHETKDRALWIVLMVIFGPVAAVIYYFAVKRPFDARQQKPVAAPKRRARRKRLPRR